MKKILFILCALFVSVTTYAQTETINWYKDGELYDTTTCESGGDIDLPLITPTKRGYTFQGWSEYLPIEYLESTGTQYIDTGFVPDQNSGVLIDFISNRSLQSAVFGSYAPNANGRPSFIIAQNTSQAETAFMICNGSAATEAGVWRVPSTYTSGTGRYQVSINGNSMSIKTLNGDILTHTVTTLNYQYTTPFFLFAYSRQSSAPVISPSTKIYFAKIYDNGSLVRDFIPVLDSYGVPCMLDKVTSTFFYNAGTGDFIAGPIVEE